MSAERKRRCCDEWLVTGIDCKVDDTFNDFMRVKRDYGKTDGRYFYHLAQSFHPDENVTPKQAHELAVNLAAFYDGFQVLITCLLYTSRCV